MSDTPRTDALVTKETYPHATQEAFCKCLDNLDRLESLSRDLESENARLREAMTKLMELESRGRIMPIGPEWDAARAALKGEG